MNMDEKKGIIDRFSQLRKLRELTQVEFGKLLGISGSAITQMEKGQTKINEKHIKLISGTLGLNEVWLRTGKGSMDKENNSGPEAKMMLETFQALSPEGRKMVIDYVNLVLNNEKKMRGEV